MCLRRAPTDRAPPQTHGLDQFPTGRCMPASKQAGRQTIACSDTGRGAGELTPDMVPWGRRWAISADERDVLARRRKGGDGLWEERREEFLIARRCRKPISSPRDVLQDVGQRANHCDLSIFVSGPPISESRHPLAFYSHHKTMPVEREATALPPPIFAKGCKVTASVQPLLPPVPLKITAPQPEHAAPTFAASRPKGHRSTATGTRC